MALSLLSCVVLVFSLLPSYMVSTTPLDNQKPFICRSPKPKSMHFTLYLQDILNKTDFNIIKGIGGPGITPTTDPFGSMFLLHDPLTATVHSSSDHLGTTLEMLIATSTLDGLYGIGVTQVNLNLKDGHSGSISLVGVFAYNTTSDVPVVGGTGDFLFVQGYVTIRPNVMFKYNGGNFHSVRLARCEFHLFWPPYYGSRN